MDPQQEQEFDAAYRASRPLEVEVLRYIEDFTARLSRAAELAAKGFVIDVPIDAWGWDPAKVMELRVSQGYTWVPSALMPAVTIAPGIGAPGMVPYDANNPPPGAIKVSVNISDYPPFKPTSPPVSVPNAQSDPVGLQSLGNLYLSVPGETYADGQRYTDDPRGVFLKHVVITPFGRTNYWEKIS